MAFAFLSEENFEEADGSKRITGTTDIPAATHFDSAADTDGIMAIEHFSELARTPGVGMPYEGAYALRIDLNGGTNPATLTETADWDTSADGTIYFRMMVWLGGPTLAMADTDKFGIWQLYSGTSTSEAYVGIQYTTANGYRIWANETDSVSGAVFGAFTTNEWHCVEIAADIDDGGSNDGSVQLYLDGTSLGTVSSLDQGAITSGLIGAIGPDAGTSGTLLIDSVIADDARVYRPRRRFAQELMLTKSSHAMLGPGYITNATLLAGDGSSTTQALEIYDTTTGDVNSHTECVLRLFSASSTDQVIDPAGVPVHCRHGAFVKLSGTGDTEGPRAMIQIGKTVPYGSEGAIRAYGLSL